MGHAYAMRMPCLCHGMTGAVRRGHQHDAAAQLRHGRLHDRAGTKLACAVPVLCLRTSALYPHLRTCPRTCLGMQGSSSRTNTYIYIYEQGASSNDDLHFYIVGKGTFDIHRKATPHACSKWAGLSRLVTVAGLWAPAWLLRLLGERTLAAALALARSSLLAY